MRAQELEAILAAERPQLALLLCLAQELETLRAEGLAVSAEDTLLSMQHLRAAAVKLEQRAGVAGQLVAVTPSPTVPEAAERALIYALLVRCRKVISCRDKLEDMLSADARVTWPQVKAEYEQKVLAIYKASWRDADVYPYNIVDNIKEYNREEAYILRELYQHLSERCPGEVNAGDAAMIAKLGQMFSEISRRLLQPQLVLMSAAEQDKQLLELAAYYAAQGVQVKRL